MAQYDDALMAAQQRNPRMGKSFFPAANLNQGSPQQFSERSDLLGQADASFYGGGNAPPAPTPTPATPPSWWNLWKPKQTPSPPPTQRIPINGQMLGNFAQPRRYFE